jgi:hypothetical protein
VTVPFASELMIVLAASRIMLHAYTRPVIERIAEAKIAAVAHKNRRFFPTLTSDRCDAGVGSKSLIVAVGKERSSLGEHSRCY